VGGAARDLATLPRDHRVFYGGIAAARLVRDLRIEQELGLVGFGAEAAAVARAGAGVGAAAGAGAAGAVDGGGRAGAGGLSAPPFGGGGGGGELLARPVSLVDFAKGAACGMAVLGALTVIWGPRR